MKRKFGGVFVLVLIMCFAFASAGFFGELFGITGNAISVEDGLVAQYSLEVNSEDSAGSNDLSTWGNGVYIGGVEGYGFSFYGSDNLYNYDPDFDFTGNVTDSFSISSWFNISDCENSHYGGISLASGYRLRLGLIYSGSDENSYWYVQTLPSTPVARFYGCEENTWVHIVGTYDSGSQTLSIYKDGELQEEEITDGVDSSNVGSRVILGHAQGYLTGVIDEVAIYDRAITGEEVQELYDEIMGDVEDSCTDSDDGWDYYERGETSWINPSGWGDDVCGGYSGDTVTEYGCDLTDGGMEFYDCPNGCDDGACVEITSGSCEEVQMRANNFQYGYPDAEVDVEVYSDGTWLTKKSEAEEGDTFYSGNMVFEVGEVVSDGAEKTVVLKILNDGVFYDGSDEMVGNIYKFEKANDEYIVAKWCDGNMSDCADGKYLAITGVEQTTNTKQIKVFYDISGVSDSDLEFDISLTLNQSGGGSSCPKISGSCGANSESGYASCSATLDCLYPTDFTEKEWTLYAKDTTCEEISSSWGISGENETCTAEVVFVYPDGYSEDDLYMAVDLQTAANNYFNLCSGINQILPEDSFSQKDPSKIIFVATYSGEVILSYGEETSQADYLAALSLKDILEENIGGINVEVFNHSDLDYDSLADLFDPNCEGSCTYEDDCIPYGIRADGAYCDIDGDMKLQKINDAEGNWASCENSYECESNLCSSGECVGLAGILDEANSIKKFFVRLTCWIAHPIDDEEFNSCVYEGLGVEPEDPVDTVITVDVIRETESYALEKSSNKLNIGEYLSSIYSTLDADELPSVLNDGEFTDTNNNEFAYTQKIHIGSDLQLEEFQDNDYGPEEAIGFHVRDGENILNYTLDFSSYPSMSNMVGQTIDMVGRNMYIYYTSSDDREISFVEVLPAFTLEEQEDVNYRVTGDRGEWDQEIKVEYISPSEVKLNINGDISPMLTENEVYKLSNGNYIVLADILYSSKDTIQSKAEFRYGLSKMDLIQEEEVVLNGESIDGTSAIVWNSSLGLHSMRISWNSDEEEFLTSESNLNFPVPVNSFEYSMSELQEFDNESYVTVYLTGSDYGFIGSGSGGSGGGGSYS